MIESHKRFLSSDSLSKDLLAITNPSTMSAKTASQGLSLITIEIVISPSPRFLIDRWNFADGGGQRNDGDMKPRWFAMRPSVRTTETNFTEYDSAIPLL